MEGSPSVLSADAAQNHHFGADRHDLESDEPAAAQTGEPLKTTHQPVEPVKTHLHIHFDVEEETKGRLGLARRRRPDRAHRLPGSRVRNLQSEASRRFSAQWVFLTAPLLYVVR